MRKILEAGSTTSTMNPIQWIGVGSHIYQAIHVAAFVTNRGDWAVSVVSIRQPHTCTGDGCVLKTNLHALTLALNAMHGTPVAFKICAPHVTGAFLRLMASISAVPIWPSGQFQGDATVFPRLQGLEWSLGLSARPVVLATNLAKRVFNFLSDDPVETILTANQIAELSAIANSPARKR